MSSFFLLRPQGLRLRQKKLLSRRLATALICSLPLLAAFLLLFNLPLQTPKASILAHGSLQVAALESESPPHSAPEDSCRLKAAIFPNGSPPDPRFARSPVPNSAPEVAPELEAVIIARESMPPEVDKILAGGSTASPVVPVLGAARLERRWSAGGGGGRCDLYSGRWVKDVKGRYPLYSSGKCPFVDPAFACQENGRRNGEYLKWRWKPHGCNLPRFNATDFLERLRGKVLMLVGDSMSKNQLGSLLCLLHEALPVKSRIDKKRGYEISHERDYFAVHFPDYNCSVEYQISYFLVSRGSRLDEMGKTWPTLRLDTVDDSAVRWKTANILVFNTGHWWNQWKTYSGKNFYQEGGNVYPQLSPSKAYKRALRTWAKWIEKNLTPRKNTVFFRGLEASHFTGGPWWSGGTCIKETKPAFKRHILNVYPWKMKVVEEVIRRMQFPVKFMNVTKLTNFRKDAHPSMYGGLGMVPGSNSSKKGEDCSHWCLPGVPDTWNELLYANLISER